ncbi:hypothetical protein CRG98_025484 [Punica granatum]|uniref:Reverse transcriptase Ty1/copia-type domain-containing protein n=1 Tax=Punica granatum TaxID=22663 RepID=A0A2I0JDW6_PUNGR|nr:hypothetical protein CRG98_025484 [Punica granatum]
MGPRSIAKGTSLNRFALTARTRLCSIGSKWAARRGSNISVWRDSWVGSRPIRHVISGPLLEVEERLVMSAILKDDGSWDLDKLSMELLESIQEHMPNVLRSMQEEGQDKLFWNLSMNGQFTTKFAYDLACGRDPKEDTKTWAWVWKEEIRALEDNRTWTIESLPPGKRSVACKWVCKIKRRADGSVERYKACLVAKCFTLVEGVDFHKNFAPVANLITVCSLLTIVVVKGWAIHQLDVDNAFLHGDLDEEVYMSLPPGFHSSRFDQVCRFQKSLYGYCQASCNWYSKFATSLFHYGFQQLEANQSLYTFTSAGAFVIVLVSMDDMILVSNGSDRCDRFKRYLSPVLLHQGYRTSIIFFGH